MQNGGSKRRDGVGSGETDVHVCKASGLREGAAGGAGVGALAAPDKKVKEDVEDSGGLEEWEGEEGREDGEEDDENSQGENLVDEVPDDLAEGQGVVVSEFHGSASAVDYD